MPVLHVEVTEDDIKNGKDHDPVKCPVALSLDRATGRSSDTIGERWAVGWCLASVDLGPDVPLPKEVSAFIRAFDRMEPIEPFAFDLNLPDQNTPEEVP